MDKQNVVSSSNGILFSFIKRNTVLTQVSWMNLENFMLSERSQSQKITYYIILFIYLFRKKQLHRDRNQWLPRARGEEKVDREIGRWWLRSLMSLLKVMKMFQNWFWWLLHNIVNSQKPLNCVFFLMTCSVTCMSIKLLKIKPRKPPPPKKKTKPKLPVVSDHRRKKIQTPK